MSDDSHKRNKKKLLRTLFLLLSSLLIVTASASVYNLMYMQAMPISVYGAKVVFYNGTDASEAGTSVGTNGTYVKFTSMSGWPNATRVYENSTVIKNEDGTVGFTCQLSVDSFTGANIDELYVRLFDNANAYHSTVQVHGTSNSTTFTIGAGQVWRVEWRIKWNANTPAGSTATATLELRVTGEGTGE